jgi:2-succinyl-5-enolpyruvyl-6-hydroxy-3-cyclohexene-1-carboxylate synthase
LNGLWTDPEPRNFRVVVVDNGGGEIFRWLDGPERTGLLERYFEGGACRTRRSGGRRDVEQAVRSVGADCRRAGGVEEAEAGMRWLLAGEGVRVLVLETDPQASHRMFQALMASPPRNLKAK